MRTGDVVKHIPSGENWLVALAHVYYVIPCGWPPTIAPIEECSLVKSCSDAEHWRLVEKIASGGGLASEGCSLLLEQRNSEQCSAMMRL